MEGTFDLVLMHYPLGGCFILLMDKTAKNLDGGKNLNGGSLTETMLKALVEVTPSDDDERSHS